MEETRSYRRRGTPDLPIAVYMGTAGVNMKKYPDAEYHPEIEITYVMDGNMTMQIGGITRTFRKEDIFIISANTVHSRNHFSDDAKVRTLVFSVEAIRLPPTHFFQQEFVQPLSEGRLALPELLQPGDPGYEGICAQMRQLDSCRIYEKDYKQRRFYILIGICLALMPCCNIISGEKPILNPGNEAVKLCMRYIHNHYFKKISLDDIGKACHLHPNYLCAVFKAYTGQTVFAYMTRYRIESAMALIKKEDLPMGKIAELTGFRSESLFYQKFKQITGLTPLAYRKTQAKKHTEEEEPLHDK